MPMVLEWDVQKAHIGVMVRCPLTFGHIVSFSQSSQSTSSSHAKPKLAKLRKYDDNYVEFGFIENSDGRPKCVMCLQALANEAMKPAKLKRHLITKHPEYKGKTK